MRKEKPINLDITSPVWRELRGYMMGLLAAEVEKLKSVDTPDDKTKVIRGSILVLEHLLSIEDKVIKNNQQAFS